MMLRSLSLSASAALALTLALGACQETNEAETTAAARTPSVAAARAATPALHTETRKFRDWLVVCDNGNACAAFGPEPEGRDAWVRIRLDAGPDARPVVTAGFRGVHADVGSGPLTLTIDGRAFAAGHDIVQVVDALASGRRLTVSQGAESMPVSLSGAAAALLWIDERQGRLNTTAALVRRGARPASTVPAAPALPVVAPAAAVAQTRLPQPVLPAAFEARADVRRCRADTAFNPALQREITVHRLSAERELWGLPCFVGAYNFGLRYFVTGPNGANPEPVRFPTSRQPTDEVVNGRYDPGDRTLTAVNKGRGVGDCGIESVWVWTGRDFALKAEREMRECWGVPADLWPTTWRSR